MREECGALIDIVKSSGLVSEAPYPKRGELNSKKAAHLNIVYS
jgi:hypothetical protein